MIEASHGMSRTFPPTQPVGRDYPSAPMPRGRGFHNQLASIPTKKSSAIDPRLTAEGTAPTRQIPAYVPMGYIDPRNIFSLRPA